MVEELRDEREGANSGEAPTYDPEIERSDRKAGDGTGASPRALGQELREHDAPAERDRQVNGNRGGEEQSGPRLVREEERARGERGLERVAAGREGVERRGRPADQCRSRSGRDAVG